MNYYRSKSLALTTFVLFQYLHIIKLTPTPMNHLNELKTSGPPTVKSPVIRLHPNPATDYFQITGLEDTALITISDLHCRVLITKRIVENEQISVSVLPRGVFIAKISTADFTIERKLEKKI